MFSPSFKKPVFIDFGFTTVVKEEVGIKTFSCYRGTPAFCSEEMIKLLGLKESAGFVDVYYNDAHCLESSLSTIKSRMCEISSDN